MNNEEIAQKVADELHRFELLKDDTETTKIGVQNHIKNLLDFEDRRVLEKMDRDRRDK